MNSNLELNILKINSHENILHFSKLKVFTENKLNLSQMIELACERIKNILGKLKNTYY